MAFSTAQLDAIESAIASGELVIEYEGKKVQYRSMADLLRARDLVRAELIASGVLAQPTVPRVSYGIRERR